MTPLTPQDDLLLPPSLPAVPQKFFDRFYFNMHADDRTPQLLIGGGLYPRAGVADGYVICVNGNEQRNLRFSSQPARLPVSSAGPLRWEVLEPLERWHLVLAPNASGVAFDVEWKARTEPWNTNRLVFDDGQGGGSDFAHFFQSGLYQGWLQIDGQRREIAGWYGQRDRSRGVRQAATRQGLNLWVSGQFPTFAVSFALNLDRNGQQTLLDGAVMPCGGQPDPITDIRHRLEFADSLECRGGELLVGTAKGDEYLLQVDTARNRGGHLAGGGYGGWHGTPRGEVTEYEAWTLDDRISPRSLEVPITDRLAWFASRGARTAGGSGVFEFSHSRSPSYRYRPTLEPAR